MDTVDPIVFSEEEKITLGAALSRMLDVADDHEAVTLTNLVVQTGIWALCKECGGAFFAGDRCGCEPPETMTYSEPEGEA